MFDRARFVWRVHGTPVAFTNAAIGNQLLQGPAFSGDLCPTPGTVSVTLQSNNISGDTTGMQNASGRDIDAKNNWWGCSNGPNASGCDTIVDAPASTTNYIPWLTKPAK